MADPEQRVAAHASIEDAIKRYTEYALDSDEVVTDAVLLLAAQHIDEDGDRCGRVLVLPRHGYQPVYITKGMLVQALDSVRLGERSEQI